jgi:hypothetical protein
MQKNLLQLASELRKETCPQRVLDEVARRISAQAPQSNRLRYRIAATGLILVLLCSLTVWLRISGGHFDRQPKFVERAPLKHAEVAEQAEGALGFIGSVLLDAGARSEKVISDKTVPRLRNSLETTKNKVIHRIKL